MEQGLEILGQEPKLRRRRSEYRVPGYRVALVREAGFPFMASPCFTAPSAAGRFFLELFRSRQDDREVFVAALLNVRHSLIGYSVVSVGCLTSTLVHPRLCSAEHNRAYVAAAVMWRTTLRAAAAPPVNLSSTT